MLRFLNMETPIIIILVSLCFLLLIMKACQLRNKTISSLGGHEHSSVFKKPGIEMAEKSLTDPSTGSGSGQQGADENVTDVPFENKNVYHVSMKTLV